MQTGSESHVVQHLQMLQLLCDTIKSNFIISKAMLANSIRCIYKFKRHVPNSTTIGNQYNITYIAFIPIVCAVDEGEPICEKLILKICTRTGASLTQIE